MKNELRIIGGAWRGRKIHFPDAQGLRPTPDRVRETLFNWLGQDLEGLHCLDLYAGSGALGLEAASRGASRIVQVERSGEVCRSLRQNCDKLEARAVAVAQMEVSRFLAGTSEAFDMVFLDPPFRQGLVAPCCRLLEDRGWLKNDARIYIEAEKGLELEDLPENWHILREKQAGEVYYRLCRRVFEPSSPLT